MTEIVLEASRISVTFGAARVVDAVDLTLRAGEITAILGASGAGKSSLLRALAGLVEPSSGELQLFGIPWRGTHPRVALAFQSPRLLPWLDVRRNVAFGLDFAGQPRLSKDERARRVEDALAQVELSAAVDLRVDRLSGGMAQRVALARCLARAPRVLLLDEPFGALDEVTREEMQKLLLRIVQRRDTAVALVTHDIDEALLVADRVVLLGDKPARVRGSWEVDLPRPRDGSLEALGALRVEIARALRASTVRPSSLPLALTP